MFNAVQLFLTLEPEVRRVIAPTASGRAEDFFLLWKKIEYVIDGFSNSWERIDESINGIFQGVSLTKQSKIRVRP